MSLGKSKDECDAVLNTMRGTPRAAWTAYMIPVTTMPSSDDGTGLVLMSGFPRVSMGWGAPGDGAAEKRVVTSTNDAEWGPVAGAPVNVVGFALFDDPAAGTLRRFAAYPGGITLPVGKTLRVPAGAAAVEED